MPKKGEIRTCREKGCDLEAAPRKHRCEECHLNAQPPLVRVQAAERRRELIPEEFRIARVPESKWPPGRRFCASCQTMVRLSDVSGSQCKACASASRHRSKVKSRFGIDDTTWQWLMDLQLGRCAICRDRPRTTRFAVDHDHRHEACNGEGCVGCVRGLICQRDNAELLVLGRHNPDIFENAARYLRTPPMTGEWKPPESELDEWFAKHPDEPPAPF